MSITTYNENLIEHIPDLLDRIGTLETLIPGVVPVPNVAYLMTIIDTIDPLDRTLIISDTERTNWQSLYDDLNPVKDILKNITSPPTDHGHTANEFTAISYIGVTPDLMAQPRVLQIDFDAHITNLDIHHDFLNKAILDLIVSAGSRNIITDAERTNLTTIYNDYTINLPLTFLEVREHIDTLGDTEIHHEHTNKTLLDNINVDPLYSDELSNVIRLGKLQIHFGKETVNLGWLDAYGSLASTIAVNFSSSFVTPPAVFVSVQDGDLVAKNGGRYGLDIEARADGFDAKIVNTAPFQLKATTLYIQWTAIGQWQV